MSDADIARYRREAEECRSFAAKMANPIDKDRLLRIADEWLKLAQARPQTEDLSNFTRSALLGDRTGQSGFHEGNLGPIPHATETAEPAKPASR